MKQFFLLFVISAAVMPKNILKTESIEILEIISLINNILHNK